VLVQQPQARRRKRRGQRAGLEIERTRHRIRAGLQRDDVVARRGRERERQRLVLVQRQRDRDPGCSRFWKTACVLQTFISGGGYEWRGCAGRSNLAPKITFSLIVII
jgi:hypothetical protein